MLRAFQWDLARQVERLDWLLAQLPRYADWGYQELYLHLEDAIEYPSLPSIARADAYTNRDMQRLADAADKVGIKVVPIVNLLGHTQYLIKTRELRDLNELRAPDGSPLERGQICPVHPRTLEIAGKLLDDVLPFCTAGKVHVGLDESFHLGKHPLSRKEVARIGLPAHFARYVGRLEALTRSRKLKMGMWADMLYFLPEAIPLLPSNVAAYEWYYYPFRRRPRVELFGYRETDLGERLRARGLEYWGCPMNGAFRFEPLPHFRDRLENILSWWTRCQKLNATGMLITSWEPYRLAIELTTVIDAAAASLWLDGIRDPRAMLERGFARVFGKRKGPARTRRRSAKAQATAAAPALAASTPQYGQEFSAAARRRARHAAGAALACDRYPFSGYPRWEISGRWDVISRRESIAGYRAEVRHFASLLRHASATGGRLPKPLWASIALRWYFAARDVWVREMQIATAGTPRPNAPQRRKVAEFRAAWRVGLRAARQMWAFTRDQNVTGPNEQILHADSARLAAWMAGEPVCGGQWQLCYRVENFEPAAQLVIVEQQRPDGSWEARQSCHTIEFQAQAAPPDGHGLTREHAAPVVWNGDRANLPCLRLTLRGLGRARIRNLALSDGRRTIPASSPQCLGTRPPRSGFPDLDWTIDRANTEIRF